MRVGRGESSGKGKTSGKGNKGQMSRTGHKHKPAFEGGQMRLIRRVPKRGFTHASKIVYAVVNVADLASFKAGTDVTAKTLEQAGLVRGHAARIKVLGGGEVTQALKVQAHAFSQTARDKITAAGGSCEVVK